MRARNDGDDDDDDGKVTVQCVLFVLKDFNSSLSVLRRPDFVFMDDYLAEGLLKLCVHLIKVSFWLIGVISYEFKEFCRQESDSEHIDAVELL